MRALAGGLVLTAAAAALPFAWGACQSEGFACGVPLEGDSKAVRTCDRPHEVCLCSDNSCAFEVAKTECPSGLRYAERPFRASSVGDVDGGEGEPCVPAGLDDAGIVHATDTNLRCPGVPDRSDAATTTVTGSGGGGGAGSTTAAGSPLCQC